MLKLIQINSNIHRITLRRSGAVSLLLLYIHCRSMASTLLTLTDASSSPADSQKQNYNLKDLQCQEELPNDFDRPRSLSELPPACHQGTVTVLQLITQDSVDETTSSLISFDLSEESEECHMAENIVQQEEKTLFSSEEQITLYNEGSTKENCPANISGKCRFITSYGM